MSRRGDTLLEQIQQAIAMVDDVEHALVNQDRQMPAGHRALLVNMRDVLSARLDRARDLYRRHIIHAAQRGGARFLK